MERYNGAKTAAGCVGMGAGLLDDALFGALGYASAVFMEGC